MDSKVFFQQQPQQSPPIRIRLSTDGDPLSNVLEADRDKLDEHLAGLCAALSLPGDSGQEQVEALMELHGMLGRFTREHASALRLAGAARQLVRLISKEGGVSSDVRTAAAEVAGSLAHHDIPSAEILVRAGIVKMICLDGLEATANPRALVASCLMTLLTCIRGLTSGSREAVYDMMFTLGAVSKICNLLDSAATADVCARLMGWVSSVTLCRERLRDLGLIPVMVAACRSHPESTFHINCIMNLALSDSLTICLKDCDVLGVMQEILGNGSSPNEVARTNAVAALALIYGSDAHSNPEADRLLEAHDQTRSLVQALEACASGRGMHGGLMWRPAHVLKMLQSLSFKERHAARLVAVGAVQVILKVSSVRGCSHS